MAQDQDSISLAVSDRARSTIQPRSVENIWSVSRSALDHDPGRHAETYAQVNGVTGSYFFRAK